MRTSDRITLNDILLHKEYFDQRLININFALDSQVNKLLSSNEKMTCRCRGYKEEVEHMHLKIKDLKSLKYTSDRKYLEAKREKDEVLEYLKQIQKEIDELKKKNEWQEKEISKQEKEIKKQTVLIDKLRHMNSTNSNLSSSMDILSRTKAKAQANSRDKTDKKRGGQMNHPLHKSKISEKPNKIITIKVKKAPTGAIPIKNKLGNIEYYVTQEVDLVLNSVITETRYYLDDKGKELSKDVFNQYAINPLVYSGNFKATTVYLNQKGTIPLQRLCDMMKEISKGSIQLPPGTISKWCEEVNRKSKEKKEEILKQVKDSSLIYVDETGVKINGKQHWIHVLTNEKGAVFLLTQKRGDKENGPNKLLEFYSGTLVHDHFSSYQQLKVCQHAECNAHIDRYLKSGIEFDHNEECKEVLELLHEMLRRKNQLIEKGKVCMPKGEIKSFERKYTQLLKKGLKYYQEQNPKMEKKYEPDFVKTFRRMLIYKEDHLRFINDFHVPYSNNAAERQCRAVKAKKKTSGQFVTKAGGDAYVNILTLLQTSKIRNENALEMLERMFH